MEVQLPVLDNEECKKAYVNKNSVIDNRIICAGNLKGGQDSCQVGYLILKMYNTIYNR